MDSNLANLFPADFLLDPFVENDLNASVLLLHMILPESGITYRIRGCCNQCVSLEIIWIDLMTQTVELMKKTFRPGFVPWTPP